MSIVKFRHYPVSKSFNSFVDDFFQNTPSIYRDDYTTGLNKFTPVNVKESENGFQLEVVAPGFAKEDFKVSVDKNILSISAERKTEDADKQEKHVRQEYKYQSVKRSFTLSEKIDTDSIAAKYENGVLYIDLSNKEEVKAPKKEITIL